MGKVWGGIIDGWGREPAAGREDEARAYLLLGGGGPWWDVTFDALLAALGLVVAFYFYWASTGFLAQVARNSSSSGASSCLRWIHWSARRRRTCSWRTPPKILRLCGPFKDIYTIQRHLPLLLSQRPFREVRGVFMMLYLWALYLLIDRLLALNFRLLGWQFVPIWRWPLISLTAAGIFLATTTGIYESTNYSRNGWPRSRTSISTSTVMLRRGMSCCWLPQV